MCYIKAMTKKSKDQNIVVNNYIRYWNNSTDNGHYISILKTDGSHINIKLRWPKGENRLIKPGRAHKTVINKYESD